MTLRALFGALFLRDPRVYSVYHAAPRPAAIAIPLRLAGFCPDCEMVFDGRARAACPACANEALAPLDALIDRAAARRGAGR